MHMWPDHWNETDKSCLWFQLQCAVGDVTKAVYASRERKVCVTITTGFAVPVLMS